MSFCTILMKIGPIFSIKKLYFDHILNTFHIFMKLTCITLYILYCIKLLYDIVFHYAEIGYIYNSTRNYLLSRGTAVGLLYLFTLCEKDVRVILASCFSR